MYRYRRILGIITIFVFVVSGVLGAEIRKAEAIAPALTAAYVAGAAIVAAGGYTILAETDLDLETLGSEWLAECGTEFSERWNYAVDRAYATGAMWLYTVGLIGSSEWSAMQNLVQRKIDLKNSFYFPGTSTPYWRLKIYYEGIVPTAENNYQSKYNVRVQRSVDGVDWLSSFPDATYDGVISFTGPWYEYEYGAVRDKANEYYYNCITHWIGVEFSSKPYIYVDVPGSYAEEDFIQYDNYLEENVIYPSSVTWTEKTALRLPQDNTDYTKSSEDNTVKLGWPVDFGDVPQENDPTYVPENDITQPWVSDSGLVAPGVIEKPTTEIGWLDWIWELLLSLVGVVQGIFAKVDSIAKSLNEVSFPTSPTVNFQPLEMVGYAFTTKFPFSIPWDIKRLVDSLNMSHVSTAPTFPISITSRWVNFNYTVDLAMFNPVMPVVRSLELILFNVGLLLAVRRILGGGV